MVAKRFGPLGAKGIDENIDKLTGFFDKFTMFFGLVSINF